MDDDDDDIWVASSRKSSTVSASTGMSKQETFSSFSVPPPTVHLRRIRKSPNAVDLTHTPVEADVEDGYTGLSGRRSVVKSFRASRSNTTTSSTFSIGSSYDGNGDKVGFDGKVRKQVNVTVGFQPSNQDEYSRSSINFKNRTSVIATPTSISKSSLTKISANKKMAKGGALDKALQDRLRKKQWNSGSFEPDVSFDHI